MTRKNPRISPWMSDKAAIKFLREVSAVRLYRGYVGSGAEASDEHKERYEEELIRSIVRKILHEMARHEYLRSAELHLSVRLQCSERIELSGNKILAVAALVEDVTKQ